MEESLNPLESLWGRLLSGQPELILQTFSSLEKAEQQAVFAHLERMASEPGWQPEQRESARAALAALASISQDED